MSDQAWAFAALMAGLIAAQVKIILAQRAAQIDASEKAKELGEIHQLVDGNLSAALGKIDTLRALVIDLMERPALSLSEKREVLSDASMTPAEKGRGNA